MYKGSMLEFYKDTIVTPDGKTVYWDHIEHKGAAAVVAVRDDGRIIMVRPVSYTHLPQVDVHLSSMRL